MSTIGGTANNNEMQHKSFLTPATRNSAILDYGSVVSDVVEIEGGTADEAFQNLLDVVAAPSPNNPFNTGAANQSPSSTANLLNGLKVYKVTSTAGHVLQAEITNVGTGYSVGGSGVSTSYGGAGTGCEVQVISVGTSSHAGKVTGVKITAHGSGYSDGDVLTISGGGNNATITIKTVAYFRTLLYAHESHGLANFTSTLAELKGQKIAYTGSPGQPSLGSADTDYYVVGVALPHVFDEPLTVVSKPSATSHRVIFGQARKPHALLAGRNISNGGVFPNTLIPSPSGLGIIYSAFDIVCQNADNALEVGDQITMPANIRGLPSDTPIFYAFAHRLDDDHLVMFTNLKMVTDAEGLQPSVVTHASSATDRFFQDLVLRMETQQIRTNSRLLSLSILSSCRFSVRSTQMKARSSSRHM